MPITGETVGFSVDEMVVCAKCAKTNPPSRLRCFYCGEGLQLSDEVKAGVQVKPESVEPWERGHNVIFLRADEKVLAEEVLAAVRLEKDLLDVALSSGTARPLLRVRTADEAGVISERLRAIGVETSVVADTELHAENPPTRIRSIEFGEDSIAFQMFNSDERVEFHREQIRLIVGGKITETLSEGTVKKTRRGSTLENETAAMKELGVLDLYAAGDLNGFRIASSGFDFSCLGGDKSLLASANLEKLTDKLMMVCPNATFDGDYRKKMGALDLVWPQTSTNRSKGVQRIGFKIELSTGQMTSNAEQFTKYSRMLAMFL